jgi:hypothetical protein
VTASIGLAGRKDAVETKIKCAAHTYLTPTVLVLGCSRKPIPSARRLISVYKHTPFSTYYEPGLYTWFINQIQHFFNSKTRTLLPNARSAALSSASAAYVPSRHGAQVGGSLVGVCSPHMSITGALFHPSRQKVTALTSRTLLVRAHVF